MDEIDNILGSMYIGGKDSRTEMIRMIDEIKTSNLIEPDDILFLSNINHAGISTIYTIEEEADERIIEYASLITSLTARIESGEYDSLLSKEVDKVDQMLNNLHLRINAHEQDQMLQVRACYDEAHPKHRDTTTSLMLKLFNVLGRFNPRKWNLLTEETIEKTTEAVDKRSPAFSFENKFDSVPSEEVYQYFFQHLVEKNHLTATELEKFLTAAFVNELALKIKLKIKHVQSKQRIIRIFRYYHKNIAPENHGNKSNYVKLLSDYFEGYIFDNVSSNWSK